MTALPLNWKPDDAAHAVRCLESWVKQGDKICMAATAGPWKTGDKKLGKKYGNWVCADAAIWSEPDRVLISGISMRDRDFISPSRSLVPALIKGMTVVLRIYDRSKLGLRYAESGTNQPLLSSMGKGGLMVADLMITETAKSYAPDMAEAGFEVPK